MAKLRTRLLAVAGVALGIVTLRRLRKRRSRTIEVESEPVEHAEPETASEHAKAAAEHARIAATKAAAERRG